MMNITIVRTIITGSNRLILLFKEFGYKSSVIVPRIFYFLLEKD